jgi:hypothetical protein
MATKRSEQPLDEGGEHGPVCPVHAGSWVRATEHRDLMSQHEKLDVLGADVRPISRTSPITCWKMRYSNRRDTAAIMSNR